MVALFGYLQERNVDTLLEKISAYHLISYALTGLVLIVSYLLFHDSLVTGTIFEENIAAQFGIVYLFGLILSRIGSLIFEPSLKLIGVIQYASYPDYIKAGQSDPKVTGLAEQSAFYRTLMAGYFFLFIYSLCDGRVASLANYPAWLETAFYVIAMVIFLLAYRKQTDFVTKRVTAACKA